MRNSNLFWGIILLLAGVFLLLDVLNIIQFSAWAILGPVFIISLGVWILWGALARSKSEGQTIHLPLENATSSNLKIRFVAGKLFLAAGSDPAVLLHGEVNGNVVQNVQRKGQELLVELSMQSQNFFDWSPGEGFRWNLEVNPEIPLKLDAETGAVDARIDLSKLSVKEFIYKSGASTTEITFPENMDYTFARIEGGAATLKCWIPQGVAALIHAQEGVSAIDADLNRFLRRGKVFVTEGWESAERRLEIKLNIGVGSVTLR
jgi:hypothetical protein